ncbi:hypothetical protein KQI38_05485 [Tissierella carlieri]|uniref:hypothetical protein n=1 Tax=Tissierella carlieri TaxID=689904 RepID=UPI001C126666|nr:hypothetical protein [Tissierella carlieri]MBU5311473.1 hypothetical protein [Tissierella carlieri]
MKKIIFVIFICIFTLVACKNNTNEFTSLPTHPNMEFVEISHQAKKENEYTTATYIIKDSTQEQVIKEYTKIFKDDSWDITFINEPLLIEAVKDSRNMRIFLFQQDNDVLLAIQTKKILKGQ